jgi:ribosomal protein S21
MATNVLVKVKGNENTTNLLRRFSRKVNSAGIISRTKSLKYHTRDVSKNVRKKQKVRALQKTDIVIKLVKLGKLPDKRRIT